ncbi:MAG: PDZ domain-containing protein, partial [Acidobacteriota bacterium]
FVSGTDEIDFNAYFNKVGLSLKKSYQPTTPYAASKTDKPGTLGISMRTQGDHVTVANVIAGFPAYEGGVNSGDELVAIDGRKIDANNTSERGNVLNELRAGQKVSLTVFRRERLMTFDLTPAVKPFDQYTVSEMKDATDAQKTLRKAWLNEK